MTDSGDFGRKVREAFEKRNSPPADDGIKKIHNRSVFVGMRGTCQEY